MFTVCPRLHTICSSVSLVTAKQNKTEVTENIRTVAMLLFYDYVTFFQDPKLNGSAVGPNSYVCASVMSLYCSQDIWKLDGSVAPSLMLSIFRTIYWLYSI
jgi:hypothetical protein